MPVKPPAPKHTTADLGDKLTVSIPSPKNWFLTAYLGFVCLFLAVSELAILISLLSPRTELGSPIWQIGILLLFWTIVVGLLVYQLAWQISGKELMEITSQALWIGRVALGWRSLKEYSAEYVRDLRASSANMNLNHPILLWMYGLYLPWNRNSMGSLAFDYGARTFRFGGSIDEAEAKQILAEIQQKFPQYKS